MYKNTKMIAAAGRSVSTSPALPGGRTAHAAASPLSRSELRRIVAELLG